MKAVVGIDVGGPRKGFHAVALEHGTFEPQAFTQLEDLLTWVGGIQPAAIAIDAPCRWALDGGSRACERTLNILGERISCFSTPSQRRAAGSSFYDWVRHGQMLYQALANTHPLYMGDRPQAPVMCETFPQAVACMLAGHKVPAKAKSFVRRQVLRNAGYQPNGLTNIDSIDAALCAIAAKALMDQQFEAFGRSEDGFIITPRPRKAQV